MTPWVVVAALAVITVALKAAGPVLLADKTPSPRIRSVLALMPAAVLAALVTVQTLSTGQHLNLDARAAGLAAGLTAQALRAPLLVVVAVTMATTAAIRAVLS